MHESQVNEDAEAGKNVKSGAIRDLATSLKHEPTGPHGQLDGAAPSQIAPGTSSDLCQSRGT